MTPDEKANEDLRKKALAFDSLLEILAGRITADVPIRADLNVTLKLPRDITQQEAEHIALVLYSLVPRRETDGK